MSLSRAPDGSLGRCLDLWYPWKYIVTHFVTEGNKFLHSTPACRKGGGGDPTFPSPSPAGQDGEVTQHHTGNCPCEHVGSGVRDHRAPAPFFFPGNGPEAKQMLDPWQHQCHKVCPAISQCGYFFFFNTLLKAVQPAQLCLLDAGRLPPFN